MITSRSVSSFHCVALITIDETELRRKQGMDGDDCIAQFDMLGIVEETTQLEAMCRILGLRQLRSWRKWRIGVVHSRGVQLAVCYLDNEREDWK